MVGINLDGRHQGGAPSGTQLTNAGFEGARLLSHPGNWAYSEHVLVPHQKRIMGIITDESHGYILPQAHILQVGNEADDPKPAPDHMSSDAYVEMWRMYTETYADLDVQWVTAGFDSGNVAYWDRVIDKILQHDYRVPDAVMVHPYAKDPNQAATLIDDYWNVTSFVQVGVSEWFRAAFLNEIWPFQAMLNDRCSYWNSWFCWSHKMVNGFGLLDFNDAPTQEGLQLVSALEGHF